MRTIIIIVEKNDSKYLDFNKIFKDNLVSTKDVQIDIVFFASSDEEYITKKCINLPYINKINIEGIIFDQNHREYLNQKAKTMTDNYFESVEDSILMDVRKTMHSNVFDIILNSLKDREALLKIIDTKEYDDYILIGKKDANPYTGSGLNITDKISYSETLSAWTKILLLNKDKTVKVYKTDSVIRKLLFENLIKLIFTAGYLQKIFSYYSLIQKKHTKDNVDVAILLRGKVHAEIASRILKEDERNIIFLFDKNRVSLAYIKELFPNSFNDEKPKRLFSLTILFKMVKNLLFNENKKLDLENKDINLVLNRINCFLTTPVMLEIRDYVVRKSIKEYMTFEETNLFGSIFSRAITPLVQNSCCIQHGFTVSYYKTMPLVSEKRWTWGSYFKEQYVLRGELDERIDIKGKELLLFNNYKEMNLDKKISVLIAAGYTNDVGLLEKWVIELLLFFEGLDSKKVTISIHPLNKSYIEEIRNKIQEMGHIVNLKVSLDKEEIIEGDMIVSGNTTIGFDAALLGKTVFFYNYYNEDIVYEYINEPYIKKINMSDGICNQLKNINQEQEEINQIEFIRKYAG